MNYRPCVALFLVAFCTFFVSTRAFNWQDGAYNAKWSTHCDFNGHDLKAIRTSPVTCGDECAAHSRCTHFTHWSGKCYLKRFEYPPTATRCNSCKNCGWINRPDNDHPRKITFRDGAYNAKWAVKCDFNGNDIATPYSDPVTCGDKCAANHRCTHFTQVGEHCRLKHFTNWPTARRCDSCINCGYIVRPATRPTTTTTTTVAPTTRLTSPPTTTTERSILEDFLMPTETVKSSARRLKDFLDALSTTVSDSELGDTRLVRSAGGAVGDVVALGQAYGMLLAGTLAATTGDPQAIKFAVELYNGWRLMARTSAGESSCQSNFCEGSPCLPHRQFFSLLDTPETPGSAAVADANAILGMILLLSATSESTLSGWKDKANWTYQSCKAFIEFDTVGGSMQMVKFGSCSDDWDCISPSHILPGHYRTFRDFMRKYRANFGPSDSDYTSKWNNLLAASYDVMKASQCHSTGLVTNWWRPDPSRASGGSASCSASGTPAAEFGYEASPAIWGVMLDYMWYRDEATESLGATSFVKRAAKQVASKLRSQDNLDVGCHVSSIHRDWLWNDFMWAPLSTSLVAKVGAPLQQVALDEAVKKLNAREVNHYYSGGWVAIATQVFNGDTMKAGVTVKQFLT